MSVTKSDFVFAFIWPDKINLEIRGELTEVGVNFGFTLRGLESEGVLGWALEPGVSVSLPRVLARVSHVGVVWPCAFFLFGDGVKWCKLATEMV